MTSLRTAPSHLSIADAEQWVMAREIDRRKAAMVRREVRLTALERSARGACCPSCFHGARYTALCDAQERAGAWLVRLLLKRSARTARLILSGGPRHCQPPRIVPPLDDVRLARAIRASAWP